MTTTITFDCTLISPAGLRHMAQDALKRRNELDGVSASHYVAWHNLAAALQLKAQEIEDQDRVAEARELTKEIPIRRKNWQGPLTRSEAQARDRLAQLDH